MRISDWSSDVCSSDLLSVPESGWRSVLVVLIALLLTGCGDRDSKTSTLRIGAGHPSGPTVYVTQLHEYLVPEVVRRVEAETDYELQFVDVYGGSIAKVSETLESVQSRPEQRRVGKECVITCRVRG